MKKKFLTIKEAIEFIGCSRYVLRKNLDYNGGSIHTFKLGKRVYIPEESILDFIWKPNEVEVESYESP